MVCKHCGADAQTRTHPGRLSTELGMALLDDIAGFGAPYPIVVLTSGDPFERPDLPELVRHATSLGLHVALSPSVTPRLTPLVLAELRKAGANAVSLSLDGAVARTHDDFRGVPGVFDDTLRAARWVREAGFRHQIKTNVAATSVRSVVQQGFRDIHRSSPLLQALREPSSFTGKFGSCEFAQVCGGSRSHSYAATGDVFGDDPTCVHAVKGV